MVLDFVINNKLGLFRDIVFSAMLYGNVTEKLQVSSAHICVADDMSPQRQ